MVSPTRQLVRLTSATLVPLRCARDHNVSPAFTIYTTQSACTWQSRFAVVATSRAGADIVVASVVVGFALLLSSIVVATGAGDTNVSAGIIVALGMSGVSESAGVTVSMNGSVGNGLSPCVVAGWQAARLKNRASKKSNFTFMVMSPPLITSVQHELSDQHFRSGRAPV